MSDRVEIEGLDAVDLALTSIPAVTQSAANAALGDWTAAEETKIKSAARRVDRQARLASRSVRATRGNGGRITAGGPMRLGGGTAGDLFFGAEFGGGSRPRTRQFRPYRATGYWFFPTVEADENTTLMDAAEDGLDAAAERWAG